MCFAKLVPKQTLKHKNVSDISDEVEIKKTKEGDDFDEMSRKRKIAESKEDGNTAKKLKGDSDVSAQFIWSWSDESIYFCAPVQTP